MLSTSTLSSELPLALLAIPTHERVRLCVPGSPRSRLQAETLPVSHRAISLVSCRAVAILIMSLRRGIPPSLISRGQYLSAVGGGGEGRQHVIRVGLLSACGPETLPCSADGPPRTGDEDVGLSEGVAAGAMLARPRGQVPEATCRKRGVNPLGKALPFASWWHLPPKRHPLRPLLFSEKCL